MYSDDELNDENEALYHCVGEEDFDTPFTVKTLTPQQAKKMKTRNGDMTVEKSFRQFADGSNTFVVENEKQSLRWVDNQSKFIDFD